MQFDLEAWGCVFSRRNRFNSRFNGSYLLYVVLARYSPLKAKMRTMLQLLPDT